MQRSLWCIVLVGVLTLGTSTFAAEPGGPESARLSGGDDGSTKAGDDDDGFGDDDDGFGDDGGEDDFDDFDDDEVKIAPSKPYSLTGFFRSQWSLWAERFDSNPFAKGRQNIDLTFSYVSDIFKLYLSGHAEYDFAYLVERDSYDGPTLDAYEWLVDTREAYASVNLGPVQLTFGRLIVEWGDGDSFSPLDVVNPRDGREPGLSDLDDLRLPSLGTRLQVSTSVGLMFELMILHESWFGYTQPLRGPFSPFDKLLTDDPAVGALLGGRTLDYAHKQKRFDGDNQQVFARITYKGAGVDLGFYAASVLDRQGVLDPPEIAQLVVANPVVLTFDHPRLTVLGFSGALPVDDLVFKWELAVELDKPVNVGTPPAEFGVANTDLVTAMLGVTYTGVEGLNLGLEYQESVLLRPPAPETSQPLLTPIDTPMLAFRAVYTALDDKLTLSAVASMFGWQAEVGFLARAEVNYAVVDGLTLGLGFVTYQPGEDFGPFYGLDRHDRIFFRLRWDFTVL